MKAKRNGAFTLVEILIVVVILAVLAATIIPQFTDSTNDARDASAKHDLRIMRAQLELYRAQHVGEYPLALGDLAKKTNADHTTTGSPALGPYCQEIPLEPLTSSAAVAASAADPLGGTVTGTTGGWIYNSTTGELRINHEDYDEY